MEEKFEKFIELEHGGGGYKSWKLIKQIRSILNFKKEWKYLEDDGAVYDIRNRKKILKYGKLVFTTDGFIVDPIFFPGGDIGKIAVCGTINDLAVMGAKPLGISLSIIVEEGFPMSDFKKILKSINKISKEAKVPIVSGDTKVSERGKIDKIAIVTAGIGIAERIIPNNGAKPGDFIITSGDLGEHGVAILATRFNYKTKIKSDSKPLNKEIEKVGRYLNACKDPTRGGLAANLVEMAEKSKVKIILEEEKLPYKKETVAIAEFLGIDILSLPSEGRFIASVSPQNVNKVLKILKKFNPEAKIIGRVEKGRGVFLKTRLSSLRRIEMPRGKLIPRIC
jgi:hydrogenase expression/formation protein HypE